MIFAEVGEGGFDEEEFLRFADDVPCAFENKTADFGVGGDEGGVCVAYGKGIPQLFDLATVFSGFHQCSSFALATFDGQCVCGGEHFQ